MNFVDRKHERIHAIHRTHKHEIAKVKGFHVERINVEELNCIRTTAYYVICGTVMQLKPRLFVYL